jgi:tetratricopeptide (TPR) repeat protein
MHLFGEAMPPPLPGVPRAVSERYGGSVERFYAAMDRRVGEFMDAAGPNGAVLIVSDHGFKIGDERPRHPALREDVFAAEWHRDPGVILAWGRGVRHGARIEDADLYDVAPTILAYFGGPATVSMRGRALDALFEPGFLPPAQERVPDASPPQTAARAIEPGTNGSPTREAARAAGEEAENREILENLRALGYVGADTGTAQTAARAMSNLATFYIDDGQYQRAIGLYLQVLAKDPNDLTALYNLGYAYKGMGSAAKAAECFERLLRARPDYTEARLVLSDCYVTLGRAGDALALLQADGAKAEEDSNYLNHMGTVLASLGRLPEAAAALSRAIALRPGEASPYLNLARVQLAQGDRAGAIATLRKAAAAVPADARVQTRLTELTGPGR